MPRLLAVGAFAPARLLPTTTPKRVLLISIDRGRAGYFHVLPNLSGNVGQPLWKALPEGLR